MNELRRIPAWAPALAVVLAWPSWPTVAALALLLLRDAADRFWSHQQQLRQAADVERLTALEKEVRSLSQALSIKQLGRG